MTTKVSPPVFAFDLYRRSSNPTVLQPVVILIHGGGYNASSADRTQSYIVSLGNELAARGFQALSIDYRLRATADRRTDAQQLPALRDAAADALEAVKFVQGQCQHLWVGSRTPSLFSARLRRGAHRCLARSQGKWGPRRAFRVRFDVHHYVRLPRSRPMPAPSTTEPAWWPPPFSLEVRRQPSAPTP